MTQHHAPKPGGTTQFLFLAASINHFSRISQHLSALSQLSSRFEIIEALKAGVAEASQKTTYDDTRFQEWTRNEADKTICAPAVIATGITSASDGVLLANHCVTLPTSDMTNK